MSKITKISGIIGAVILVLLDAYVILNSFTLGGIEAFNNIINNMIPCGLILGGLALYVIHNKISKKSLSVATLVVFVLAALIRVMTVVLYILERIYATYLSSMVVTDYLDFAKFTALGILAIAVVFLMIYLMKGKFSKTSLALCGIANVILCVVWVFNVYTLVTEAVNISSGVFEVVITFFKGGLAKDAVFILSYLAVFWSLTTMIKNKEKA